MFLHALLSLAQAGDAVELEVIRKGQEGVANPGLVLVINQFAEQLVAEVSCAGATARSEGSAAGGDRIKLELAVPVGVHQCTGQLDVVLHDGTEGSMPLSFEVEMFPPLGVEVPRDKVDLEARTLMVRTARPPQGAEIAVYGPEGLIGQGSADASVGAQTDFPVSWTQKGDEVVRIEVTATDADGFTASVELFPWFYEIPHEDVVFETASAAILPAEEPKLSAAMSEVQGILDRYGAYAEVNLYVAGYTDTVGPAQSNQRLSKDRAAAIAAWFKQQGFSGAIYYQGFGEGVLAVPTADNVDEAANRRALYILAAEPPPASPDLPRSNWSRL